MGPWLFWLAIICSAIGAMLFAADRWIFGSPDEFRGMSAEERVEGDASQGGSTPSVSTVTPRSTRPVSDTAPSVPPSDGYQEGLSLFIDGLTHGAPALPVNPANTAPPAPAPQVSRAALPAVEPAPRPTPRPTQTIEQRIRDIAREVGVEVVTYREVNRNEIELELRAEGATSHAQIPEVVDVALSRGVIRDFDDRAMDANTQVSVNPQSGARIFTSRFTVDLP